MAIFRLSEGWPFATAVEFPENRGSSVSSSVYQGIIWQVTDNPTFQAIAQRALASYGKCDVEGNAALCG